MWTSLRITKTRSTASQQRKTVSSTLPALRTEYHYRLVDDQQLINERRTKRIVTTYYIARGRWSGIIGVIIVEATNANFGIFRIRTLFNQTQNLKTYVIELKESVTLKHFFAVFDGMMHNDGTNNCPYLIFAFCHDYMVCNMTEEDIIDVAQVIQMYP